MLGAKRRQRQRLVIALVVAGALVALSVIVSVAASWRARLTISAALILRWRMDGRRPP